MAWTITSEVSKAALDGLCAIFNGGQIRLLSSAPAELAMPTFGATAFAAASTATPSVAASNTITDDASVTAGTIVSISFRTSGGSSRITGTVGVGSGDYQVSDNVIPGGTTTVGIPGGVNFSLTIS